MNNNLKKRLIETRLSIKLRNPETGLKYNPPRYSEVTRMILPLDYGKRRKERQENERLSRIKKWRSLTARQQLAHLDHYLGEGKGAQKQRARIAKALDKESQEKKQQRAVKTGNNRK